MKKGAIGSIQGAVSLFSNAPARRIPMSGPTDTSSVLIENVPHIVQKPDFCGEACVAMALQYMGHSVDQDWVYDMANLNPEKGRGLYTKELAPALNAIGFVPHHPYKAADSSALIQTEFEAMVSDLRQGIPSVVCMHYDSSPHTTEHFRLILGYDPKRDEVVYHEPAEKEGAYQRMPRTLFETLWPLGPNGKKIVIRMPLRPDRIVPGNISSTPTDADYVQHIIRLKKTLPKGFHVSFEKPFVVVGNQSKGMVRQHAHRTIRSAVRRLKKDYFTKDPDAIITVWLFGDAPSYRRFSLSLFGEEPGTPYGYYTETHEALVMNIATGAGTLIHELVHPFMRANFPDVPPWFNEGLASLYECSTTRDGSIWGLTNWRLNGLQREIRQDGLPSFEVLMNKNESAFYGDESGDNYAQSRYLLQYLQERGLLKTYYHAFLNNRLEDPTGYQTLKAVLNRNDITTFQDEWKRWAMRLRRQ